MAGKPFNMKTLFFMSKTFLRKIENHLNIPGRLSSAHTPHLKFQKYSYLAHRSEELQNQTLLFHVEGALLKSSSLFSYFMLVAFEAGWLLRALILLLLYPLVSFLCLVCGEAGLKIMVFVCFVGIKRDRFVIGRSVLPKFFLEDVGYECFDVVMRCGKKVGVTNLPEVMVDCFLRDYMGVEAVVGRELKVFCGYYLGLMEEKKSAKVVLKEIFEEEKEGAHVIGIGCFNVSFDHQLFSPCKEIYLVSEADKKNWQVLPREKYPKPLIFHDGRLAFRPTPVATLVILMWVPFGLLVAILRVLATMLLPLHICIPVLSCIGMRGSAPSPNSLPTPIIYGEKSKGILYVCNHKTLLDPVYASAAIRKPVTAVTYSLSKLSELVSPIKTIRLARKREEDSKMIEKRLSQGNLVICPEGTTCREPYLLRFSPLFAETTDDIVPIAIDFHASMFYGTTASGLKCLDPLFIVLNPTTNCDVKILEKLPKEFTCGVGGKSKFEVANYVQAKIAEALGFECTNLTRKDKYLMLAGNEGKA
ncbi:hypothetical protein SO802_013813 [Lithocarpus litseifolius]|uniref:Phospholipid/glycerol acyltransferase domain-containing protein n=1 Tax=Lithocarpus litseifolius TaxID=425828 RepID=A0AAW2D771_9ROSI